MALRSWWLQYVALTFKSWKVIWNRKASLVTFVLAPPVSVIMLYVMFASIGRNKHHGAVTTLPLSLSRCVVFDLDDRPLRLASFNPPNSSTSLRRCITVGYVPDAPNTAQAVMKEVGTSAGLAYGSDIWEFSSVESMSNFMWENPGHIDLAVVFSPSNFRNYELWSNESTLNRDEDSLRALTLQRSVNTAITKQAVLQDAKQPPAIDFSFKLGTFTDVNGEKSQAQTLVSPNATRCERSSPRKQDVVRIVGSTLIAAGVGISTIVLLVTLVSEKQKKLVGKLRQMGLMESAYISSWSSVFIPLALLSSLLTAIIMKLPLKDMYVFQHTSFAVLLLTLFVFFLGMIAVAFILSSLFTKPVWIMTMSAVIFLGILFSTLVMNLMNDEADEFDEAGKCFRTASAYDNIWAPHKPSKFYEFLVFWFPWISYGRLFYSMYAVTAYDSEDFSIQGLTATTTFSSFSPPSLLHSIFMIVGLWLVSIPLTWYIGQAFAGKTNGKRPYTFPFHWGYWGYGSSIAPYHEGDLYAEEREKSRREGSLRVVKLSKTYKSGTALREVSATMNNGEVFALLGHNGAGKTTMINILTGLTNATYGEVFFAGHSLKSEMSQVQAVCGICPQFDALWEELNAKDHLRICAALQGLNGRRASEEIKGVLEAVDLIGEANELVTTFSGGMKRRLSVCMAVLGDHQKLIFLDEPTTGVDTINRKRIWQLIEKLKQDRVIVLTTHNMEEADALGDRIGILHQGALKALGSSLFLKKEFGSGYQVSLLLTSAEDAPEVEATVKRVLPGAKIVQSAAGNMKVSLNHNSALGIPKLLAALKANLPGGPANTNPDSGRFLKEWGFSNTTLEEVFLRLCSQNNQQVNEETALDAENLCLICGSKRAEVVTLYTRTGMSVKVPNAICVECALDSPVEDGGNSQQTSTGVINPTEGRPLATAPPPPPDSPLHAIENQPTRITEEDNSNHTRFSLFRSQIWAVFYKNFKLNMAQKKLLIFQAVVFLVLAIMMKVLFQPTVSQFDTDNCPGRDELRSLCSYEDFVSRIEALNVSWDAVAPQTPSNVASATAPPEIVWETQVPTVWYNATGNVDLVFNTTGARFIVAPGVGINQQFIAGQQQLQKGSQQVQQHSCFFSSNQLYIAPDLPSANATFNSLFPSSGVGFTVDASGDDTSIQVSATALYKSLILKYSFENIWIQTPHMKNVWCQPYVSGNLVGLYRPFHSLSLSEYSRSIAALTVNTISNAVLARLSPSSSISTTLKTYPALIFVSHPEVEIGLQNVILIMMAMSVFFPIYVRRILMEREAGLLRMVRIAGMQPAAYWVGNYFYDFILSVIASSIFFVIGKIVGVIEADPFICAVLILVWAHALNALTVFIVSFFKSVRGASLFVVFAMVLSAVATPFINIKYKSEDRMPPQASIFPPLGLARVLYLVLEKTSGQNNELAVDIIVMIVASTAIYCIGVFINELRASTSSFTLKLKIKRPPQDSSKAEAGGREDIELVVEKTSMMNTASKEYAIKTENLSKVFTSPTGKVKVAVDGLTLGLEYGEIFGLLGANGAGKTTALSMLSGSLAPTEGSIVIAGTQLNSKTQIPAGKLSICPQSDIFWEDLSVWSHFMFYSYLKGLNKSRARASIQTIAGDLDLSGDSFQKPASSLSGGQLRRLSLGVSLVGSPSILLMDEMTTGLDPVSRSTIWDVIKKQSNSGRLILLTTHSMEEADTLCTRIGIMSRGQMKCLGAPLFLKNHYSNGYVLTIVTQLQESDNRMDTFIQKAAPDATLISAWQRVRKYSIKMFDLKHLFEVLEDDMNKMQFGIREWQIEQTTLQDVFLRVSE